MAENLTGVVQAISQNGKSIKVNDTWYGAFNASQLKGVERDCKVSFNWEARGNYRNIKGNVKVLGKDEAKPSGGGNGNGGGYSNKGVFPIPAADGQRSICRQNALTNAVNFFAATKDREYWGENVTTDIVQDIVQIAREFEKYTTGDLDKEAMEELERPF